MMQEAKTQCQLRALVLISGTKVTDRANELLIDEHLPVFFQMRGMGTASSEMMDLLGLGSTQKILSFSILPKQAADKMIALLDSKLGLGRPGTGIAFTTTLTGVSALTLKVINEYSRRELFEAMETDAKDTAACSNTCLIVAVVNQGYSEDVMEAAREYGAGGGTVLHARQTGGEAIMNFLGVAIQEEKDMVLIITSAEMKATIMKAIGEKCGMHSEAQGFVFSTHIDAIVGLSQV